MPNVSRSTHFYLLEHALDDYISLLNKLRKDDFLFIDLSHSIYTSWEDEKRLATFLNELHTSEISWLLFCFDFPQTRTLFSNFQTCVLTEQNKDRESDFLLVFNCNVLHAAQVFNVKDRRLTPLFPLQEVS